MNKSELESAIQKVPFWWHTIELAPGVKTDGQTPESAQELRMENIPEDLSGKSVLDIGCWDGYFAFECEKRNASRVLAVDNGQQEDFVQNKYGIDFSCSQGFKLARQILESSVEYEETDFYSVDEKFDIVLFLGILYHTKHPLLALEHLRSITEELAVIESHYIPDDSNTAYMRLYAGDELNQDPTNWWGPTTPCIRRMCEAAGFSTVELVETYFDNDDRVIFHCQP